MDLDLKDRTFLVTAASRGLGFSVAKSLVSEGAQVIICGRNEESLKKATSSLGELAEYYVADVSKKEDVQSLVKKIATNIVVLDGLFVNAGGPCPPRPCQRNSVIPFAKSILIVNITYGVNSTLAACEILMYLLAWSSSKR